MNERVLERGLEADMVDLSESENENWCEVSVCVAASVHLVLDLTPPVNLVCEVGFPSVSVSDCDC